MAVRKEPNAEKPTAPTSKWQAGAQYECTLSKSPGYKIGHVYSVFKDSDGLLKMKAGDGFTDICSMLLSGFRKV